MSKPGDTPGSWRVTHDRISPHLARILHPEVLKLAAKGLGPVGVARQLSAEYQLSVCPGTVRHWMVGDRNPQGGSVRNVFNGEPSPALSYIIGANKGDGCTLVKAGIVKLEVTDKDFVQVFNANMATLFSRERPNKIFVRRRVDRLPMYIVKYASRQLVQLLRQPLKKLLELAFAFPSEFLRGFFDAEGHVDVGIGKYLSLTVGAENSDRLLLLRVKQLLKTSLNVDSTIHRKRKAGSIKVIRGKAFAMRRTSYSLSVSGLDDIKKFATAVGFSIQRKVKKLQDALLIRTSKTPKERPVAWRRLYHKQGGEWRRKDNVLMP